jgi:hypothetical protein
MSAAGVAPRLCTLLPSYGIRPGTSWHEALCCAGTTIGTNPPGFVAGGPYAYDAAGHGQGIALPSNCRRGKDNLSKPDFLCSRRDP